MFTETKTTPNSSSASSSAPTMKALTSEERQILTEWCDEYGVTYVAKRFDISRASLYRLRAGKPASTSRVQDVREALAKGLPKSRVKKTGIKREHHTLIVADRKRLQELLYETGSFRIFQEKYGVRPQVVRRALRGKKVTLSSVTQLRQALHGSTVAKAPAKKAPVKEPKPRVTGFPVNEADLARIARICLREDCSPQQLFSRWLDSLGEA